MIGELPSVNGMIAKVRDHTVGVDSTTLAGDGTPYQSTRYFNNIEIDLDGSTTTLRVVSRWPDRLFLQNGDRILAIGKHTQGRFEVDALCNLTDGSNYLLVGSPWKRRQLRRVAATLLPAGTATRWFAA